MAGRFKRIRIPEDVQWGVIDDIWYSCRRCHRGGIRGNGTAYVRRSDGHRLSFEWFGFVCPHCRTITAGDMTEKIHDRQLAFIILAAQ